MPDDPRQIDWISLDDKLACQRLLLERAAERVGIDNLAHWLKQDPSTIRNQLARRERKSPSADLEAMVWLMDSKYREQKAALTGDELRPRADLVPEDAMRDLMARAQSKGFVALEDVAALYSRMRKVTP